MKSGNGSKRESGPGWLDGISGQNLFRYSRNLKELARVGLPLAIRCACLNPRMDLGGADERPLVGRGDGIEGKAGEAADAALLGAPAARAYSAASSDDAMECRICGGEDKETGWLKPCECAGSMSFVHKHCLQKWIKLSNRGDKAMECEVCHVPYSVVLRRKVVCDAAHICTCKSCSHIAEAFILVFCLACLIVMMFVLFPSFETSDNTEKTLLIVLFSVTVIMSFFALRKVYQRWRRNVTETMISGTAAVDGDRSSAASRRVAEEAGVVGGGSGYQAVPHGAPGDDEGGEGGGAEAAAAAGEAGVGADEAV